MTEYQVVNGTYYHKDTPKKVVTWLEFSRQLKHRIRIFYGDVETGRDWMEEFDTIGHVGRSTGSVSVPLLIRSRRSDGGTTIMDNKIVRITTYDGSKQILEVYRHPNYHQPEVSYAWEPKKDLPHVVAYDGEPSACFLTREQAERFIAFIKGERNRK